MSSKNWMIVSLLAIFIYSLAANKPNNMLKIGNLETGLKMFCVNLTI